MDTLIFKIGGSIIRHGLTSAAGALVTAGYLSNSDATQAVGAVMALIGIAWSAYQKRGQVKEVQAALVVPVQTSLDLRAGSVASPVSHAPGDGD